MTTRVLSTKRPGMAAPRPLARDAVGLRAARVMSMVIAPLALAASLAGLLADGLYRDAASVSAMLRAYDLVTVVIVVPALVVSLRPSWRRTVLAQLIWLSALAYGVYNYAIYVFGSAFNDLFLVHVALFSLSTFGLGLALANVDVVAIGRAFRAGTPVQLVAALLMLLGGGLGAMWVFYALRFAVTGEPPAESQLVLPATSIHLGYVLDLALLVPACVLSSVLLWRRAPWGYLLGTVTLLFATVYQVCYMTALLFQTAAGVPSASWFDPAEPVILGVFAVAAALMLAGLRPPGEDRRFNG